MDKRENGFKKMCARLTEKQKRAALVCLLFVGVVGVGCANYFITNNDALPKKVETVSAGEDAFAVFRQEKSESRTEQMSYIESVVTSEQSNEETKQKAQQQKLELAANMEAETAVEGMIRTTLNADAVVTVSQTAVSVVIDKESLTDAQAAQIAEIVTAQTGQSANNIKIMPQQKNAKTQTEGADKVEKDSKE